MCAEAERQIGHLYPKVNLSDGSKAPVVAWLWAHTVTSPNPVCNGAYVPLTTSFVLSSRPGKEAIITPLVDKVRNSYRFEIKSSGVTATELTIARSGTKTGRGTNFRCLISDAPIPPEYIKVEGKAGRIRDCLIAVVAEVPGGRLYLAPSREYEDHGRNLDPGYVPEQELPKNPRWFSPPDYGMPTYGDLFTRRQLSVLTTFSDLVGEVREKVLFDGIAAGLPSGDRLHNGGTGVEAYADAVAVELSMALSRHLQFGSKQSTWYVRDQAVKGLPQQALPMVWDFCEANPFGDSSANFKRCAGVIADCIEAAPAMGDSRIDQKPAQLNKFESRQRVLVSTDPPYYDNVGYADLSDFFYVWLRRALRGIMPSLFATMATPKVDELVASPYRDHGGDDAETFWLKGMKRALVALHDATDAEPTTLYYAYKQREQDGEDRVFTSTGWATFLQAVYEAGFVIGGTWPLRTNNPGRRVAQGTNALATAVVLVCRKRLTDAPVKTRASFVRDLKRELPGALKLLQASNIAPVDLAQAAIGPGIAVFSRNTQVLEASGSAMPVRSALIEINRVLDEVLAEHDAEIDASSRFCVAWFEQYGLRERPYSDAEGFAIGKNIPIDGLRRAGVFRAERGKARLLQRDELRPDWDPHTDIRITDWACVQQLARAMTAKIGGGVADAARLVVAMGPARAENARTLAYRLHTVASHKRWTDEALAYNILVISWPQIQAEAARFAGDGPAQSELRL
jgi:putative DNA methylase